MLIALSLLLGLASCSGNREDNSEIPDVTLSEEELKSVKETEVRAVWISYTELGNLILSNNTQEQFTAQITNRFRQLSDFGFNTIIVHSRAFADAFYKSDLFPTSSYMTGTQGGTMLFDPLAIMVAAAHQLNMKIEAWVNPYRITYSQNLDGLAATNPAKVWLSDAAPENDTWVIKTEKGYFFNPAVKEVQDLIVAGVEEIVKNYEVDGIHFDDYFYPSTEESIDAGDYAKYTSEGGKLALVEWRCNNVSTLVKTVYAKIKSIKPAVTFGISPSASIKNNLSTHYADLTLWATEEGYVDYLCPQIYFGFTSETMPFISTYKSWQRMMKKSKVKLYVGLALYKSGTVDEFADTTDGSDNSTPKYEFINNTDLMARQVSYLRQTSGYKGFFIYSYSYLFDNDGACVQSEVENLRTALQ